ncbi:Hypothetical protein PHPALM_9716 [Phytophthora palmivora]|uniref:ABC Superfamily n=1 Tax=Phytophthora palmivora TaxID=4796 RepID=A0A2P4Y6L1_9STRA|nr:Hypothetical protein PHPALM_9716 [Phytophthora palmivora]
MITGSESDEDTTGSTKNPTPSQDAPSQDAPLACQEPYLDEGKARAQVAKAAPQKRTDEGATAKKSTTPSRESGFSKGYHSLFGPSDEDEEEGAVTEPQEISNDLDEQQERYQAAQRQGASAPLTPVYLDEQQERYQAAQPQGVSSSAPLTPVYLDEYYPRARGLGHPCSWSTSRPLVV